MDTYIFAAQLCDLVAEMNRKARENPDILGMPPAFSITMSMPAGTGKPDKFSGARGRNDGGQTLGIELAVVYESGGGEESSYAINDYFRCMLSENGISSIQFEREGLTADEEDAVMTGTSELPENPQGPGAALLAKVRGFCEEKLPPALLPPEDWVEL